MKYTEQTALFACAGATLVGIVAAPETPAETGIVIIVGGPQYRIGSHRQFVLLSRSLATAGYPVLRFDYRGMGDSEGEARDFQGVSADIGAAIDALQSRMPAVKQVALWGLCDGASAALLYCWQRGDPRVGGLCLLNPWVRSAVSLARTRVKHYYARRLMDKTFWVKLLHGQVPSRALTGLIGNLRLAASGGSASDGAAGADGRSVTAPASFQQGMAAGWADFTGSILLLLSGDDYTAKEFIDFCATDAAWKNAMAHPRLVRHDLPEADHTFSSAALRAAVNRLTLRWLAAMDDERPGRPAAARTANPLCAC